MAKKKKKSESEEGSPVLNLTVLPTKEIVPLPGLVIPFYLSPGDSADAVKKAIEGKGFLALTLQSNPTEETPATKDLSRVGGLGKVIHSVMLSDGELKVKIHIQNRVSIKKFQRKDDVLTCSCVIVEEPTEVKLSKKDEELLSEVRQKFSMLSEFEDVYEDHIYVAEDIYEPGALADFICSILPFAAIEAQRVMAELDGVKRLSLVKDLLDNHIDALQIKERISDKAESELGRAQQEELLREQLRQIRAELGEEGSGEDELVELKTRLSKKKLPAHAKKEAEKQLRRLQQMHADTSEAALSRTYLEWILELPWSEKTNDKIEIAKAREILDEDHYGLQKTKERILDFLGVRKLKKSHRGPVLLFVGPPGVGKTSLGRSIARALGRKFAKVSVGGLRDEAELRGHRRTYVGALPGRIIQGLKTAGTTNPVFMLDEIDKIGSDFRGDPSSVLLEILDPEQNTSFEDHYLNIPFNLSQVMFICTANVTDSIPAALLDRMEIIEIAGYTAEEKLHIARRYLVPWEQEENGLSGVDISLSDEALLLIIEGYTRESGVRELRRTIGAVFRKAARSVAEGEPAPKEITKPLIEKFLGTVKYVLDRRLTRDEVGVATGLAWTKLGGEIMPIEVSVTKGKGTLAFTGQLGEVMRESGTAALTYVLSRARELGIDPDFYERSNVHIHVPQGAIPKDGPSAGIAIATALVSVLTSRPISRNVAMTGEITLRGSVLPIGGLKEKALAALRVGINTVVIPKENERELAEFPDYLKDKVNFAPVETLEEVFELSLLGESKTKNKLKGRPFISAQPKRC